MKLATDATEKAARIVVKMVLQPVQFVLERVTMVEKNTLTTAQITAPIVTVLAKLELIVMNAMALEKLLKHVLYVNKNPN